MPQHSRITPAQQELLDRFTCERLSADPGNQGLTWSFFCGRNPGLANHLREDAWEEDKDGLPTAYYVIKNPSGRIAMYFSLRCGVLFDPDYVRDVMDRYQRNRDLMDALENRDCPDWARTKVEQIRDRYGRIPSMKKHRVRSDLREARDHKRDILGDEKKESNEKMIRVDMAFPAIELVHFCVNDLVRGEWASYKMGHPMGQVMFWHFVVPKMLEINRLIGCEYVYLFAADSTEDELLVNYYETALHFQRLKHLGAIKPRYDFTCVFLGQRLHRLSRYRKSCLADCLCDDEDPMGLADHRKAFFENFNILPGDDLV